MYLLYLSLIWVAGIFSGSLLVLPLYSFLPGLFVLLTIPLLKQHLKSLLFGGICLLVFAGGNFLYVASLPASNPDDLNYYNEKTAVTIRGYVCSDPELRDNAALLQVKANTVSITGIERKVTGKVMVRISRHESYRYGDILSLYGLLRTPGTINDFDYGRYLAAHGIGSLMYYPEIELVGGGGGSCFLTAVYNVRGRFADVLLCSLPEPQGALAQAILLGKRENIPPSLTGVFSRTGTAHLLAISGLHLSTIMGMLLSMAAALFGRRWSIHILVAFLVLWLYVVFTGMRPPVVRGAIMGSMYLTAEILGRQRSGATALCFAAAVMLGLEPLLLWDASFQLSFLAMAGLIFISPPLRYLGRKHMGSDYETPSGLRKLGTFTTDTIAVTISAVAATWPVIAYHFGLVSFTGLPATFFALPALPFIIVISLLVCIAGVMVPVAGQVLAWAAWLFLSYLLLIISFYDSLPFSFIQTEGLRLWHVGVYYTLLAGIFLGIKYRGAIGRRLTALGAMIWDRLNQFKHINGKRNLRWIAAPLLLVTILLWCGALTAPDGRLHVTVLDVGQGDAILVQTPSGQDILIDGGPSPLAVNLGLGEKLPFYDRTLEMVVLTQPHADHLTGLIEVLERYRVGQALQPEIRDVSPLYDRWCASLARHRIPVTTLHAGQRIEPGSEVYIDVLHPPEEPMAETADDVDNNGLVLRLSYKEVSFLLTADIYHEAEWYLISSGTPLRSTVLKVAHHGSRTSSSTEFLEAVSPEAAIISAGAGNRFGHPHMEVTDRLMACLKDGNLYCTAECGTVEFISDGQRIWTKTGRKSG